LTKLQKTRKREVKLVGKNKEGGYNGWHKEMKISIQKDKIEKKVIEAAETGSCSSQD
jgi:hypothetical protein